MSKFFIRRPGQDPFEIPKNQVVPAIKNGKLSADDEISPDGRSWISLGKHKQLSALFKTGATRAPVPSKRRKMSESEFYSSDRVYCPKCGFEQDRSDSCMKCNIIFDNYWNLKKAESRQDFVQAAGSDLDSGGSGFL